DDSAAGLYRRHAGLLSWYGHGGYVLRDLHAPTRHTRHRPDVAVRGFDWGLHSFRGDRGQRAQPPPGAGPRTGRGLPRVMSMASATSGDVAVSCRNVQKHFGSGEAAVWALRGVDFETRFGELGFLVGPSGCGKTTLISIIAGLLDRTAGELSVLGVNVDALSPSERVLFRRQNLGFIFQQFNLLPALTAAENVAVPLLAAGTSRQTAVDRAGALLSQLGLGSRLNAMPLTLSGGQQQRVAIARALVHE